MELYGWHLVHCISHQSELASYRCVKDRRFVCAGCYMRSPRCPDCYNLFEWIKHGLTYRMLEAEHNKEKAKKLKEKENVPIVRIPAQDPVPKSS